MKSLFRKLSTLKGRTPSSPKKESEANGDDKRKEDDGPNSQENQKQADERLMAWIEKLPSPAAIKIQGVEGHAGTFSKALWSSGARSPDSLDARASTAYRTMDVERSVRSCGERDDEFRACL